MCGLVGMAGFLEYKHKKMMEDLLFLNALRGKDSTGLSAVSRDREVTTRKMTVPGYEFIEVPVVQRAMKFADQLWMGHGRFKTQGEINRANAHPFEVLDGEGDIILIGAHNGTLNNKWEIENKIHDKFDTDSEALFNWLVEAPDFKTAIAALDGAWSLVWWDPTADSIHFCRNKERPLVYAWTKDHKVLIWASESWMLFNAARRNGVELLQNDRGISCHCTLEDTLYTLEIPQARDVELPDLKREGGFTGKPVKGFRKGFDWSWWDAEKEREKKEAERKKEGGSTSSSSSNVVRFGTITGFQGQELTLAAFDKIKAKGCAWCKDPLTEKDLIFAFLDEDNLVCEKCMRDKHTVPVRTVPDSDDPLDDEVPPFDLRPAKGKQKNSEEGRRLLETAVNKAKIR